MNDIFSIFNPDWWMDENNNALQMTDAVLFLLLAIPVAYLFIYALASLRKYKNPYPPSPKRHRFLVLFVVLKNGKEVIESINHFLDTQTYPRENTTSQWLPHNCPKKIWLRCSRCRSTLSCPIKNIAQRYMPYSRSWSAILLMSTMPSPYSIQTTKLFLTH